MAVFSKRSKLHLSPEDIRNLSCFVYRESDGLIASAFSNLPLALKQHCVRVGIVAGQMAFHAPDSAIPPGMTRCEYANAVRYGCLYHDIGAYLVYNQQQEYPAAGERFLREQFGESDAKSAANQVSLQTLYACGERHNGQGYPNGLAGQDIPLHAGLCAIANELDIMLSGQSGVHKITIAEVGVSIRNQMGTAFSPEAVMCFMAALEGLAGLYKRWRRHPPLRNQCSIKPLLMLMDNPAG